LNYTGVQQKNNNKKLRSLPEGGAKDIEG